MQVVPSYLVRTTDERLLVVFRMDEAAGERICPSGDQKSNICALRVIGVSRPSFKKARK
jgi:hypothetical protein